MLYVIKNNKNIFIKLDSNGAPTTCVESVKGVFEYSKAKNILNCLPKTLRRMHFNVEAIPDIVPKKDTEKKIIQGSNYIPSKEITKWVDKFGVCSDILDEARFRMEELINLLNQKDREFLDILHIIELEKPKDMYNGWRIYKSIKENRESRRQIKDELLIVENVLKEINPSCLKRDRVQKAIDGLFDRKYTFRVVEEVSDNEDL